MPYTLHHVLGYLLVATTLVSCNTNNTTISGTAPGKGGQIVYLEKVGGIRGQRPDSCTMSAEGAFRFKVRSKDGQASFVQLRQSEQRVLVLLAVPGQKTEVLIDQGQAHLVKGSSDNALLIDAQNQLRNTIARYDSLLTLFTGNATQDKEVRQEINRLYIKQKQQLTTSIIANPNSLSSAYLYYMRIDKNLPLFGGLQDRFLAQRLVDSLGKQFPKSAYVTTLRSEVIGLNEQAEKQALLDRLAEATVVDLPEIELESPTGTVYKLSDLHGKVVLLSFWLPTNPISLMDNQELKELYKKYKTRGFEIYQVSLDTNRTRWEQVIAEQELPWINVSSLRGAGCPVVRSYAIQSIPTDFLINRKGEIVARDVFGDELANQLKKLMP